MFFKELKKYLSYSYNQESIKLIVDKNNTTLYEQLINNGFKNVSYLDKFQNYTFKDLLIVNHENTLLNLGKNLKELNFKIVVIRKIKYNFKDFDLLFSSSIIENILSNPISIYQRKKNFEERIQVWNEYYSFHLEKLYEDKKMDLIFYFGINLSQVYLKKIRLL